MVDLGFNDTHGPPHRRTASDHASQESRAAHQPWLSSFFELSSWERVARSTLFHCWLKRASVLREVTTVRTARPRAALYRRAAARGRRTARLMGRARGGPAIV
eukprot:COSAG03_NODE_498_length_7409_cov_13.310534_8_plen_103_part_00